MLSIIIGLALLGFVLWLILTYIPMPDPIKKLIIVVTCLIVVLWLAQMFGLLNLPAPGPVVVPRPIR